MPSRVTQTCTEVLASVDTLAISTMTRVTQVTVEILVAAPAPVRRYITASYHRPRSPRAMPVNTSPGLPRTAI
jgi:hypothetical protein